MSSHPSTVSAQAAMLIVRTQSAGEKIFQKSLSSGKPKCEMRNLTFTKLCVYYLFSAIPLAILYAFLSLFHQLPIQLNDKPVFGLGGFLGYLIYIPMCALGFACSSWISLILGRWLHTLFCKVFRMKTEEN